MREIIDTFERIETERGGLSKTDPWHVLDATAKALGLPMERVRAAMVQHWTNGGAG